MTVPVTFTVVVAGLFGLLIGSFLNVVVWRVPRGESVVRPPSACPACGHSIRRRDNVPVLSWLVLQGRCRDCLAPIAVRYPLVEIAGGASFAGTAWLLRDDLAAFPAFGYLAAISLALALIDLDVHRLPDAIVLPSYPVAAVLLLVATTVSGEWWDLARAGIGGGALLLLYFILRVIRPDGMGLGDVKLAGVLGRYLAWLGWGPWVVGAFGAFLLGGLFSIALLASRRAGRRSRIPFGPWMIAGAWLGIVVGAQVWAAYLGLMV